MRQRITRRFKDAIKKTSSVCIVLPEWHRPWATVVMFAVPVMHMEKIYYKANRTDKYLTWKLWQSTGKGADNVKVRLAKNVKWQVRDEDRFRPPVCQVSLHLPLATVSVTLPLPLHTRLQLLLPPHHRTALKACTLRLTIRVHPLRDCKLTLKLSLSLKGCK